jgi:hypothetical protein
MLKVEDMLQDTVQTEIHFQYVKDTTDRRDKEKEQ